MAGIISMSFVLSLTGIFGSITWSFKAENKNKIKSTNN
jgi:hypothetical protein